MRDPTAAERIHGLEIPLAGSALLVPSAAVAEVANLSDMFPVPGAPAWVLGVIGWRSQAVPVVSFEALIGNTAPAVSPGSRIVIFYPFPGRRHRGFYGLLTSSEPRPQPVSSASVEPEDPDRLPPTPLIAAGVKIKGRTLFIPDFDALQRVFYP